MTEQVDYFELDTGKLQLIKHRGYLLFYMPDHPLAVQNGMVALHRHVASVDRGRWLTSEEMVLFANKKRSDCRPENLEVIARSKFGQKISREIPRVEVTCPVCGTEFIVSESQVGRRRTCSPKCRQLASRKLDVSPEELEKLVWEMPTVQVAEQFGVSDKAIEKLCKKHSIRKPPRGYWAKMRHGHISPEMEDEMRGKGIG